MTLTMNICKFHKIKLLYLLNKFTYLNLQYQIVSNNFDVFKVLIINCNFVKKKILNIINK